MAIRVNPRKCEEESVRVREWSVIGPSYTHTMGPGEVESWAAEVRVDCWLTYISLLVVWNTTPPHRLHQLPRSLHLPASLLHLHLRGHHRRTISHCRLASRGALAIATLNNPPLLGH